MTMGMFDRPYAFAPEVSKRFWKDRYIGPTDHFEHGEDTLVARFEKTGSDGQSVEIEECWCPATFFKIRVLSSTNSVDEMKPGFVLSTGSGGDDMREFVKQTALLVASGMLGMSVE